MRNQFSWPHLQGNILFRNMFHSDCNPESELSVLSDLDWQNYSESVPYEVIFDSNEGRYLRATRDIKRGMFLWKKTT